MEIEQLLNIASQELQAKSYSKAFEYYNQALLMGSDEAMFHLGAMYEGGIGVEKNDKKAFEYLYGAAKMGNSKAILYLKNMKKNGLLSNEENLQFQELLNTFNSDNKDTENKSTFTGKNKIKKILLSFVMIFTSLIALVALVFALKQQDGVRCSFLIRDGQACLDVVKKLDSRESETIYKLYLKACEYKSNEACLKLGDFYFFGNEQFDITQNQKQSRKYYYDGCEYGNGEACLKLGEQEENIKKAQEFYKKGCSYNNPKSCYEVAKFKKNSNSDEAIEFYKKSCELNYAQSCYELGAIYGDKQDFGNEGRLLEKASQIDTENYGMYFGNFLEKQGNKEKALQVYTNACETYEVGGACYHLAVEKQEPQKALELYLKACEYKSNEACLKLGDFYFFGNEQFDITQNQKQSRKYYYDGCEYGNGEACLKLGEQEENIKKAQEFYKKGCSYNNPKSCYEVAKFKKNSNSDEAIEFYKKSCELNYAQSCYELGVDYAENYFLFQIEDDKNKMTDFYKMACDLNHAQACSSLAKRFEKNKETKEEAIKLYDKACNQDDMSSCHNMAIARMNGELSKNYSNIKDLFRLACKGGYGESCFELGKIYQKGDENFAIPQDLKQAFRFFSQGCEGKSGDACLFVGNLYQEGNSSLAISKDSKKAEEYFIKGCENKNGKACYKIWEKNKNTQKGIRYLSQSAELGNPDAYRVLAEEYKSGNHLNRDLKKALFCMVQSCKNGNAKECKTLADMYQNGSGEFEIKPDDSVAFSLYKHACDKGEYGVCDIVAEQLDVDDRKKLDYYQKACRAKKGKACYKVGRLYEGLKEEEQAIKAYQDSCALREGEACFRLGELSEDRGDSEMAERSFSLSCDIVGLGCNKAGKLTKEGERKEEYYEKACGNGEYEACFNLAEILRNQDVNKAKKYYKKSCERIQKGCAEVGEIYANEGNDKESIEYFKIACENGDGESCLKVGERIGNRKDSKTYYQKACGFNQLAGCLKYAQTLQKEDASDEEIEKAYWMACEKGNIHACKERGDYWWKKWDDCKFWYCGDDKKQAKKHYLKACELGDETSCQKEKELK